MGLKEVMTGTG